MLLGLEIPAAAQGLIFDQTAVVFNSSKGVNYQSYRGVPRSEFEGYPVGSDGRAPSGGSTPTYGQFIGMITYGAIVRPVSPKGLVKGETYTQNAEKIGLPRGINAKSEIVLVLRAAQLGAPYISRKTSFRFGAIIIPPSTDVDGKPLAATVRPTDYWYPEPFPIEKEIAQYHWSPNARCVYATEAGEIRIRWRTMQPSDSKSSGLSTTIGGHTYAVVESHYAVTWQATKPTRKLYWTEDKFANTGKPISVPPARVNGVNFVYNAKFPETVTAPWDGTGSPPPKYKTIWFEQNTIRADKIEGRVFVEFLGEKLSAGTHRYLGNEIVDVVQEPTPVTIRMDLGDRITAYSDRRNDDHLKAEPTANNLTPGATESFLYTHQTAGGSRTEYYAVKETTLLNQVVVHWTEEGVEGLRWPLVYARYEFDWPRDASSYSHHVRPFGATETEAKLTAVPLPSENLPTLQYQDQLPSPLGAKITENFSFYTFLDKAHPTHRSLLRFTSGGRVAFEHIYSSLNTETVRRSTNRTREARPTVLRLDEGNGSYGTLPAGEYFSQGSSATFTIEAWVYVRQPNAWSRLIDFGNGAASDNVYLGLSAGTSGKAVFGVYNGSEGSYITSTKALVTNEWMHLAATFDKNKKGRIYINGMLDGEGVFANPPKAVVRNNCFVGRSNWAGDLNPRADFDDLRIWSTERTEAEVVEGMETVYPANTAGLLVQYTFQKQDSPGADTSGHGYSMNLFGESTVFDRFLDTSFVGLENEVLNRIVTTNAYVGDRINPPPSKPIEAGLYPAGYVLRTTGDAFHQAAYLDPFVHGFEVAKLGAIIPVNAVPGTNRMEVWWFRSSKTNAVKNQANGFKPTYWPSVIGLYTLGWPTDPAQIVLASNDGSGRLESLQAKGTIYTQNNPALPGYNPNEEHALMLGGQVYALRDDLNLTETTIPAVLSATKATYSSAAFVLLDYLESDGRPAMRTFKVLREKPSEGIVFDYIVTAGGSPLQAPMPLPFLPPPVENVTAGGTTTAVNHNTEPAANSKDLPTGWESTKHATTYPNYDRFTYKDRKDNFWVMRGLHAGLPTLEAGTCNPTTRVFTTSLPTATAVVGQRFSNVFHTSRQADSLVLTLVAGTVPSGLSINGLTLVGTPLEVGTQSLSFAVTDKSDGSTVTTTLTLNVVASGGTVVAQGLLELVSKNSYAGNNATFVGRPPFLAADAVPNNSFTMRFYYKTQEGFAWPGIAPVPTNGTIVPYLRSIIGSGQFVGAADEKGKALDIIYRPVWPSKPPTMGFGQTLTNPKDGLPAVRGQTSVQLLYQQAIAMNISEGNKASAVVLHDPTREKSFALVGNGHIKLPGGVRTESYQGKTYFPNLPPHLVERFFYDPNRGTNGSLVLKGEFKDELFGEKYLLLNVLAKGSDLDTVKALCPSTPRDEKTNWDAAVEGLTTRVKTFYENPVVPGEFIVNRSLDKTVSVGNLAEVSDSNTAVDSYALSAAGPGQGYVTFIVGNGGAFTPAGEPVTVYVIRVTGQLHAGELKIIPSANPLNELTSFQHTVDLAGKFGDYQYEWKINPPVDGIPPATDETMSKYQPLTSGVSIPRYTLGGSGIKALVDNYIVMRYRPANSSHSLYKANASGVNVSAWSEWTKPQLAEGWIKRVLAGINPFNQRVTDLYNNTVNTDANILTSAGKRWEGDVALNLENINNYGLIEIYETVLRRGKGLSIESDINFGPANDALLLAAGYLNDLYMLVGNEAYADAANPTIGIGTKDNTYGDIATALFAFKGQTATLLEEELALLRGRDNVLQPGVGIAPVYNRLVWNYTRGIDSGEVIYALNYNILDQNTDGKVDAADAAKLFPQGHGDAYGHYLTAIKGYYSLLMNNNFDWVPRTEAVTVLGQPVQVDYVDERKFAAAASAVARTGRQVFDLTWRKDYQSGRNAGWNHFGATRLNANRTKEWGLDQWASRVGHGSLFNWVIGNAILPETDLDPTHEGIQKIDRTTVPELAELATTGSDLQTALDNAEGRLTPLGLAEGSIAFDINPTLLSGIVAVVPMTHFEQVFERAKGVLNNAVASFDDAKDVTRLMRSEQDSLMELQASVAEQELAYKNSLIELYGTPYTDDIGPGKTYLQGYDGPDLIHYTYTDKAERVGTKYLDLGENFTLPVDIQNLPATWMNAVNTTFNGFVNTTPADRKVSIYIDSKVAFAKPPTWSGRRSSPGAIQQSISEYTAARNRAFRSLNDANVARDHLEKSVRMFEEGRRILTKIKTKDDTAADTEQEINSKTATMATQEKWLDVSAEIADSIREVVIDGLPKGVIMGLAFGGDLLAPARFFVGLGFTAVKSTLLLGGAGAVQAGNNQIVEYQGKLRDLVKENAALALDLEIKNTIFTLEEELSAYQDNLWNINERLRELDDADRAYRLLVSQGDRLQHEREVYRQRAAAVVQGFRTRDAAFRIFRNEKLERYKTLFDLAARYAYMAATAYDYETGLLDTDKGRAFINRIVSSRALGVVKDGEPQYAGSKTGDPGLSSALAEMKADWDVLKGRLGFNNPDTYGTTVSLRTENLRILPGTEGDAKWQDVLYQSQMDNLLDDPDIRRHCLQIDLGNGLPVPGIVLSFSTVINAEMNLFGQPLAAGDNGFDVSSFATKIFGMGVVLEGYLGMNDPNSNSHVIDVAGGVSSGDPPSLDPNALSGTPYIYLIPVGVDSMRSPPLGDQSRIRSWNVKDVAIPTPFNIGGSDFSTKKLFQSADSLSEPLFGVRKHQAFRPVSDAAHFNLNGEANAGAIQMSQFSNRRLIGRSVWNSQWKIVIPGRTLLKDSKEGLRLFIETVRDVKLHFITYSYSGN